MIKCASALAPGADFRVGIAESLPVPPRSMDLIAAAGSLNYADLNRFLAEAVRVLRVGGALLVYDFSQGRSFRDSNRLDLWFTDFLNRYPMPIGSGHEVSPEILSSSESGLRLCGHEDLEVGLMVDGAFYLNYMMTETNVATAVQSGVPEHSIRAWCANTLEPVFQGSSHEVQFRGYFAVMLEGTVA